MGIPDELVHGDARPGMRQLGLRHGEFTAVDVEEMVEAPEDVAADESRAAHPDEDSDSDAAVRLMYPDSSANDSSAKTILFDVPKLVGAPVSRSQRSPPTSTEDVHPEIEAATCS
jgi:hypothetical protein